MTLDDFRSKLDAFWAAANREADELKDPYLALERLNTLYRGFDTEERELANQVLAEWVLSDEEAKRFDAVALIRQFQVTSAVSALRALADELERRDDPGAPFEREKVEALLSELDGNGASSP